MKKSYSKNETSLTGLSVHLLLTIINLQQIFTDHNSRFKISKNMANRHEPGMETEHEHITCIDPQYQCLGLDQANKYDQPEVS